jgi:hypothetical protein
MKLEGYAGTVLWIIEIYLTEMMFVGRDILNNMT